MDGKVGSQWAEVQGMNSKLSAKVEEMQREVETLKIGRRD